MRCRSAVPAPCALRRPRSWVPRVSSKHAGGRAVPGHVARLAVDGALDEDRLHPPPPALLAPAERSLSASPRRGRGARGPDKTTVLRSTSRCAAFREASAGRRTRADSLERASSVATVAQGIRCSRERAGTWRRREKRGFTCVGAMTYLGLRRRAFDKHIRPRLPPPVPCGTSRVFERADLDRAWNHYRASLAQALDGARGWTPHRAR